MRGKPRRSGRGRTAARGSGAIEPRPSPYDSGRVALQLAGAAAMGWAVWSFVPVSGRTLAERWRSAGNLSAFIERGWVEATGATGMRAPAKPQVRRKPAAAPQRPTEGHTEADRRAVERLLADRLNEKP